MDEAKPKSDRLGAVIGISFSKLLQYLVAGAITFASLAGGIYLGFSTAMKSASSEQLVQSPNHSFLDLGKPLPDYECWDVSTREKLSLIQLSGARPTLLLFVSSSCDACHTMSDYWQSKVIPGLRDDIALVCIYDDDDWYGDSTGASNDRLFSMARVVTTDRDAQKESDGITATPTLVAINRDGRIVLIATGFSRSVDSALLDQLM